VKRPLKPDELRLWSLVASTVHPLPGRRAPQPVASDSPPARAADPIPAPSAKGPSPVQPKPPAAPRRETPHPIEPRRKHRLSRERDPIAARIDLHGMTQDQARAALERFLVRAWDDGYRAALVITGKGVQGDGVLKRRVPEWLAAHYLAPVVAGVSDAHRRHGGEGALYVALKRRPRG
jgi:DNA-nicking Smr family endonuclease